MFWPAQSENLNFKEALPAGNYIIRAHPMRGFYFEQTPAFDMPPKLYGDTVRNAQRIVSTFLDRPGTTGVLLDGEKGAGKTLLAKRLAIDCAALGIPCITINQPMVGDAFNSLLQSVQQPCMLFFDEFEKVYHEEGAQEQLLTLMDGVFTTKKLIVLTVNNSYKVNDHMKNRPGRLFYALKYDSVSDEFIKEYCADCLKNPAHAEGVRQVASMFYKFNFDMLKAMVEEMNRYSETAQQVIKLLNAKPSADDTSTLYDVKLLRNGEPVTELVRPAVWRGNPLASAQLNLMLFEMSAKVKKGMDELHEMYSDPKEIDTYEVVQVANKARAMRKPLVLVSTDLRRVDPVSGNVVYAKDGYTITFSKQKVGLTGFEVYGSEAF